MRRLKQEWRQGRVVEVEALSPAGRSFGQTYGLRLTPAFALFDQEGRLIRIWMGADGMPTWSELEAILREGG